MIIGHQPSWLGRGFYGRHKSRGRRIVEAKDLELVRNGPLAGPAAAQLRPIIEFFVWQVHRQTERT